QSGLADVTYLLLYIRRCVSVFFFFSSRRRHTRFKCDWSSDVCSSDLIHPLEPVLREGMYFLRDQGLSIGCYANRYMRLRGADGALTEKSYGQSWWQSLSALERWAESHPTHVRIFGAAMKYLSSLGPAARLRLY